MHVRESQYNSVNLEGKQIWYSSFLIGLTTVLHSSDLKYNNVFTYNTSTIEHYGGEN